MATQPNIGLTSKKRQGILSDQYGYDPSKHYLTNDAAAFCGVSRGRFLDLIDKHYKGRKLGTSGLGFFFPKGDIERFKRKHQHEMHNGRSPRRAGNALMRLPASTMTEDAEFEIIDQRVNVKDRLKTYKTLLAEGMTADEAVDLIKRGLFE